MTHLRLSFEPNIVEILTKNTMGEVRRINVPEIMARRGGITINSEDLTNHYDIQLNENDFEYKSVGEIVQLKRDEKESIQDSILGDLEAERMLPSIEEIRNRIGVKGVKTEETSQQSYEDRQLGLPTLEDIRKRI